MTDFDDHLAALERFVRDHPDKADGWLVLGFVRHFTGQYDLAIRTFDVLQRLDPSDADVANIFLSAEVPEAQPPAPSDEEEAPADSAPAGEMGSNPGADAGSTPHIRVRGEPVNRAPVRSVSLEPAYELPSP
jgi:hypothetical protein